MIYESNSPMETGEIAFKIAKTANSGDIFCLSGDLGAGKTVFAKSFAGALGITEHVTSPTFTILNVYKGDVALYHFDMYRIEEIEELYNIGFEEYFYGNGICLVEWPENVSAFIPDNAKWIKITKDTERSEDYRKIEIL